MLSLTDEAGDALHGDRPLLMTPPLMTRRPQNGMAGQGRRTCQASAGRLAHLLRSERGAAARAAKPLW